MYILGNATSCVDDDKTRNSYFNPQCQTLSLYKPIYIYSSKKRGSTNVDRSVCRSVDTASADFKIYLENSLDITKSSYFTCSLVMTSR